MKLDRNLPLKPRRGKYAIIKLRDCKLPLVETWVPTPDGHVGFVQVPISAVDFGDKPDTDFFLIRLKDVCAEAALRAYAKEAAKFDKEYANEVDRLSDIAAKHPSKRKPD